MTWLKGARRIDPEGYACRIGALWARLLLPRRWAIVFCQTVWVRDPLTWRLYLRQRRWRAHEHHHVWQEAHQFPTTLHYLAAFVWQYVRHRGHDAAPLEQEADAAADRAVEAERLAHLQ
ncbi:MAG: hypothetical protein KF884_01585 [Fimbriimonadaceae bacterium]|nr:hypothetical protein [Fimbriimonadaceae bacterium]QYK58786.1 MAG: hypothetical protein KF884_01585 [Fimbriimonadaceae bacterium]